MPNYRALKISRKHYKMYQAVLYLVVPYSQNYAARIHGLYHECSDCFEHPPKIPTWIKAPKKLLAKFSYPQKSQNQKFPAQKNPSLVPVT